MSPEKTGEVEPAALRARAEELARAAQSEDPGPLAPHEAARLLHELRVQRIELEIRNEELRRSQDALRRANDLLDLAQWASQAGAWDWDIATGHVEWSEALFALFGLDPARDTASFEAWRSALHTEDAQIAEERIQQALTAKTLLQSDYRIVRPSGEQRWVSAIGRATYDDAGRPVRMAGICLDITDRKRFETALRESEARFATVFHSGPMAIAITRLSDNRFTDINEAGQKLTGFTAEEALGHTALELGIWANPGAREHFLLALRQGTVPAFELEMRRKDGALADLLLSGALIDVGGEPCLLTMALDITDRMRAEQALRASEKRFRVLIEHSHDAIALVAADGTVLYDSPSIARVLGYAPDERIGRSVFDSVHPEYRAAMVDGFARFARQPGAVALSEVRFLHKDGTAREIEGVRTNLLHEPAVRAVVVNYRDVTERKRAEAERLELERRLLHAQKLESLGVLAGGIAHDFNNLLMGILGSLDIVLYELPSASPAREGIERALRSARRATDLTRQMLAYSGRGRLVVARVDLCALARENAELLRAAVARDVTLSVQSSGEGAVVDGDPGQLQQVIMNLITNAAEAVDKLPGAVVLTTGVVDCDLRYLSQSRVAEKPAPGRFAFVQVADTGCGMNAQTQERLFDPFFTTKVAGRGLGMSAVLGIVRAHGGAIVVDSTPGHGTTIRVLFPAQDAAAQPAVAPAPSSRAAAPRSGLILVVDDESAVRETCHDSLKHLGFKSLVAASGDEALALLAEHASEIVCVILDLTMPGKSGVETCREIRRSKPDLRVLVSSGFDEEGAMPQFQPGDVDGFIQKPYLLRELRAKLDELLGT